MPRRPNNGGCRGRTVNSGRLKHIIRSRKEIEDGISSTSTVTWDPFRVLPKEIYLNIFNKLDIPTDKQNFMNAHVKFYDLFKASRVNFLFGKVFGNLTLDEGTGPDTNLIGLRLVCREWDESIQNYYQLHPDHFPFVFCKNRWKDDSNHLKEQYKNGYNICWGYDGRLPEGFRCLGRDLEIDMGQFVASHPSTKNPFLTRKISVDICRPNYKGIDEYQALQTLLSQLDTVFNNYGQHVWHFCFRVNRMFNSEMYSRVLHWLRLMPELKTLQIDFDDWTRPEGVELCATTKEFKIILGMELPKIKRLQNLHVSKFPSVAFNKLLEGMKALEKVEIGNNRGLIKGFKIPTSLAELALQLGSDEDIEYLSTSKPFPVMRKLILDIELSLDYSNCIKSSWKTVWTVIEEKFPALEDLHLSLPKTSTDDIRYKLMEQSLDCRLNLKKLKRLSLAFYNSFSLDFLQEIKTLQELKIYFVKSENKKSFYDLKQRESVKFNRDLGTMWESNVWQEFPNLRKLSICESEGIFALEAEYHLYEKGPDGNKMYRKLDDLDY